MDFVGAFLSGKQKALYSKALFVFLYFQIAYLAKVFFSLPLIKACMVFLASLYSISTTLHVDF